MNVAKKEFVPVVDTDRIGYETLSKLNPTLLSVIRNQVAVGLRADQIEWGLRFRYGHNSAVVNAAIGATHYIERCQQAE